MKSILQKYIEKVSIANAKKYDAAAEQSTSSNQYCETINNEGGTSSSLPRVPTTSSNLNTKRGDRQIKLDIADIGIQKLNDYECSSCSCGLGRKCSRRVTIGEISDARASFWGDSGSKFSTKARGEKNFNLLIEAKCYNQYKEVVFQFALDNTDGEKQTKTLICEGTWNI